MAAMRRVYWTFCNTVVPRRTFTTGTALRCHPPGIPNDTVPFLTGKDKVNKVSVTFFYVLFCTSGLLWPVMAARDQSIRIGAAISDSDDS